MKGSTYGPGSVDSTVWINGISCVGTEDSPEDCKHGEFGNCVDCGHEKDISIECDSITTQGIWVSSSDNSIHSMRGQCKL